MYVGSLLCALQCLLRFCACEIVCLALLANVDTVARDIGGTRM
jgi:hypothetical protein